MLKKLFTRLLGNHKNGNQNHKKGSGKSVPILGPSLQAEIVDCLPGEDLVPLVKSNDPVDRQHLIGRLRKAQENGSPGNGNIEEILTTLEVND